MGTISPEPKDVVDILSNIYNTSDPENKPNEMIEAFFKSGQLSVFYGSKRKNLRDLRVLRG